MERVNRILKNVRYQDYLSKIQNYEKDRKFCKHDYIHFLDVCRIAMILYFQEPGYVLKEKQKGVLDRNTEQREDFLEAQELIYAAGLLHDIGRFQEYETGIGHEIASARLAKEILLECGFSNEESKEICNAIVNHRKKEMLQEKTLSGLLYCADKKSRPCFCCPVEKECRWDDSKKNLQIVV